MADVDAQGGEEARDAGDDLGAGRVVEPVVEDGQGVEADLVAALQEEADDLPLVCRIDVGDGGDEGFIGGEVIARPQDVEDFRASIHRYRLPPEYGGRSGGSEQRAR